jgi:hypothetical protein
MGAGYRKAWCGDVPKADVEKRDAVDKSYAWRLPIQHQIAVRHEDLAAFNERIEELEKAGHHGHATQVLKRLALSMAVQIDELRCLLVVPKTQPSNKADSFSARR